MPNATRNGSGDRPREPEGSAGLRVQSYSAMPSLLKSALDILEWEGLDGRRLLEEQGVNIPDFEDRSRRIPLRANGLAWRIVTDRLSDPAIGVRAALRHFNPGDWQSLGLAILYSASLRQALERVTRYFDIVSDAAEVTLEETDDALVFAATTRDDSGTANWALLEFGLTSLLILLQEIMPEPLRPRRIDLLRPQEQASPQFETLFRCPVFFGCARERVYFDLALADIPLRGSNESLAVYQDSCSEQYLSTIKSGTTATRVRREITRLMVGRSPRLTDVAAALHISGRQLQRRLSREKTTFENVVTDIRRHLSVSYLADPRHSLSEIAFMLGYSSQSNFTRAFGHWFAMTPLEFRKRAVRAVNGAWPDNP